MNIKEFIKNIAVLTKTKIIDLASEQISNTEKKERLDCTITDYIEKICSKLDINFFVRLILKQLLLPNVSIITQIIFDFIKVNIKGITVQ